MNQIMTALASDVSRSVNDAVEHRDRIITQIPGNRQRAQDGAVPEQDRIAVPPAIDDQILSNHKVIDDDLIGLGAKTDPDRAGHAAKPHAEFPVDRGGVVRRANEIILANTIDDDSIARRVAGDDQIAIHVCNGDIPRQKPARLKLLTDHVGHRESPWRIEVDSLSRNRWPPGRTGGHGLLDGRAVAVSVQPCAPIATNWIDRGPGCWRHSGPPTPMPSRVSSGSRRLSRMC